MTVGTEKSTVRLVAIDDDAATLQLISTVLAQDKLEIFTATDPEIGLQIVYQKKPQIVLTDLMMPKLGGMELLERIQAFNPTIEIILMTGQYSTESAVEAIQKGASDYMNKPLSVDKLRNRVEKLVQEAHRAQRAFQLDHELVEAYSFEGIIGRSVEMLDVYTRIRRVAPHFHTALVTGPTGTGKELVARSLHHLSPAASGPFVVCNCSAIIETLFESELFGYVKGAFTGATQDKIGMFEYANGGALLLDEIGEMPLTTQAKLLRVLQSQEIQRVGSPAARKIDVRVVAATNRDLPALVAEKQFREDLFYRLSMVEIKLPSMMDRIEDLPLLVRHFLEQFARQYDKPIATLTRRAQALLARHPWPGNVRELENVFGHACMMAEGNIIDVADLPSYLSKPGSRATLQDDVTLPLEELDRRHARRVLDHVGGNKVRAAEILGISRATLYRLIAENPPEAKKEFEQPQP
ncbi:MAG TPA: sigma-54 dependent transcriptional regulator [Terriglobia bacterium]|nr:sigma-54 dependent transcriptional regulator [Terriglobia bacterium]